MGTSMEEIASFAATIGNEVGARLQEMLGRLPDPQEFMAFYATVAGTVAGNALSEIVNAAGKETGAQWLGEVLAILQLTARRNGADIILTGGISLKTMAAAGPKQPSASPPPSLDTNICPCEISAGTCRVCEREIDDSIDRFTSLIRTAVHISTQVSKAKICQVCKSRLVDGILARSIRKNAASWENLPAMLEIFVAVAMPQLKGMMPGASWDETMKAVSEVAVTIKK